jgi:hypothetical protein
MKFGIMSEDQSKLKCLGKGKEPYKRNGQIFCRKPRNNNNMLTKAEKLQIKRRKRAKEANCNSKTEYSYINGKTKKLSCRKKRARKDVTNKQLLQKIRDLNEKLHGTRTMKGVSLSTMNRESLEFVYDELLKKALKEWGGDFEN